MRARKHTIGELARKVRLRVAGLMSGTSADGIDVAVVDIDGRGVHVLGFGTVAYPPVVRRMIFDLFRTQDARIDLLSFVNMAVGEAFAEALIGVVKRLGLGLASIDLVGSHGQTVYHDPAGRRFRGRRVRSTLQIGEPSVIAERTGITTVADFRPRDIAAGGQGAPLVPYADYVLFGRTGLTRAVQNIGGIANVTFLPAGGGIGDVLAFDTGLGNMIIDRLAERISGGKCRFDRSGRMAARGTVRDRLLTAMMRHPYLRRKPPKTTGREMFGAPFADRLYAQGRGTMAECDLIATATAFTARSIADAYRRFLPRLPKEVILCGGGARNGTLVRRLADELPESRLTTTNDFGIDIDAKEAVSFAILAAETIRGRTNNVPAATGAARAVVLGKILPP